MDFIVILRGEAFEQFSDGAFGAVLTIDKRGDDGNAQVRRLAVIGRKRCACKSKFLQTLVDCITGKTAGRDGGEG